MPCISFNCFPVFPSFQKVVFYFSSSRPLCSLLPSCVQTALDNFPEISVVTELKKDGETPAFKVRLSGKAYNKKTMKPCKTPHKAPQVRGDSAVLSKVFQEGAVFRDFSPPPTHTHTVYFLSFPIHVNALC